LLERITYPVGTSAIGESANWVPGLIIFALVATASAVGDVVDGAYGNTGGQGRFVEMDYTGYHQPVFPANIC